MPQQREVEGPYRVESRDSIAPFGVYGPDGLLGSYATGSQAVVVCGNLNRAYSLGHQSANAGLVEALTSHMRGHEDVNRADDFAGALDVLATDIREATDPKDVNMREWCKWLSEKAAHIRSALGGAK